MRISIDERWRVDASNEIDLPLRASAVWGQMRDYRRFIAIDPLHAAVKAPPQMRTAASSPVGTPLVISHRILGIGPDRIGRMLRWREGRGFAFSDLSRGGPHRGFPHVCLYEVSPLGEASSRLTIAARGRWTARWMPRWLIRLWLGWVLAETAACLRREFNRHHRWLEARQARSEPIDR